MKPVAVMIPTFRRPEGLARALQSVFAQAGVQDLIAEIVVVDNSPEQSAWETVHGLLSQSPWPISFVHCPEPGVANARNAGLSATQAKYIAFLDDDEAASLSWLANLWRAHQALKTDVTFGPIEGVAEGAPRDSREWLDAFFSRSGPQTSGLLDIPFGCGNSLLTRATTMMGDAPFDTAANMSGGEDDRLFQALKGRGGTFGWACDAWVLEYAPASRSRPSYALTRAMAFGQGPSKIAFRAGPKRWIEMVGWMGVGVVQAVIYGSAFAVLRLLKKPKAWPMADKAARGLGKILWMLRLDFYGAAIRT